MMDLSQISIPNIQLHEFVLLVFLLVLGVYTIFSAILYYHWREYGTDPKVTIYTLTTYFSITIPLLLIMGTLALLIN